MKSPVLLGLLLLLAGCDKTGKENDSTAPVISINNPVNGQVFTAGSPIQVSGTISDDNYIAEVHIHISNLNTGVQLMDVHLYPAGKTGIFNQSITAAAGVHYKIQVIAKDRAVNESRATVEVSCN